MEIIIQPILENGRYPYTKIIYHISAIDDQCLCKMPKVMHSIPAAIYSDLIIQDDLGEVSYSTQLLDEYPYEFIGIYPARKLSGNIEISYQVYPRVIDETCKCGPYLDFREEKGGINTGGESFLLKFNHLEGKIKLIWKDIIGVCGYGEGNLERNGNINDFRDTYYAFGDLQQYQQDDFHFYYFERPPFDIDGIAKYTASLFLLMKNFFQDPENNYAVFLRKDPYTHSGGSALKRSYMLGYNDTEEVTLENQKNILAHELVHNYPHILDDPYGIGTWYEEGIAEYYSVILPLRYHLITQEEALYEIQKRSDSYYHNPMNHLDNLTIGKTCWEDKRRQTIPYGRGFFYLANLDVKIRKHTNGKMNLDDIVITFIQKERQKLAINNQTFFELVEKMSGVNDLEAFNAMARGEYFIPLSDSFDDLFTINIDETNEIQWMCK